MLRSGALLSCVLFAITQTVICSYICPPPINGPAMKRLKSTLFCDYDPQERPVKDRQSNITIYIYFKFRHISFIDFKNQFDLSAWVIMNWRDEFLTWDPQQYENIKKFNVRTEQIWFPDAMIVNTDMKQRELLADHTCDVGYSGTVRCLPQLSTQVYCEQRLKRWPFDTQDCSMGIISYSKTNDVIDFEFQEEGYTVSDMEENNEWEIEKVTPIKLLSSYNNISWTSLSFEIELDRNSSLYATTVIVPAFVLAALTLISFWVRGVTCRACVCCTALLGNAIYLLYIGSRIAATGRSTPKIALFYRDAMILTVVALIVALSVEHARDQTMSFKAPGWLVGAAAWLRGRGRAGTLLLGEGDVEAEGENQDEAKTSQCSNFATLLDRLAFIVILCTYAIMLAALLP